MTHSLTAKIVVVATGLYLLLSMLNWQNFCDISCRGRQEWNGLGVVAGLVALALLVWELIRMGGVEIAPGRLTPALVSIVLAIALVILTVLTFLDDKDSRTWAPWAALVVSIVIAAVALSRGPGRRET